MFVALAAGGAVVLAGMTFGTSGDAEVPVQRMASIDDCISIDARVNEVYIAETQRGTRLNRLNYELMTLQSQVEQRLAEPVGRVVVVQRPVTAATGTSSILDLRSLLDDAGEAPTQVPAEDADTRMRAAAGLFERIADVNDEISALEQESDAAHAVLEGLARQRVEQCHA